MKKLTFEFVKNHFSNEGCCLTAKEEEYVNAYSILSYIAVCGHHEKIKYHKFQQGHGRKCKKCASTKYTFEFVKNHFSNEGCCLTAKEEEYVNTHSFLSYIAVCGHTNKIAYREFRIGYGRKCKKCVNVSKGEILKNIVKEKSYRYEFVKVCFENAGHILLTIKKEYKNSMTSLDYICKCGELSRTSFCNFLQGQQCKKCGNNKRIKSRKETNKLKKSMTLADFDALIERIDKKVLEI